MPPTIPDPPSTATTLPAVSPPAGSAPYGPRTQLYTGQPSQFPAEPVPVPQKRPGPPPKVTVAVLVLALLNFAVGIWALTRG